MTAPSGGRGIEDMLNLPHMDDILKENGLDGSEIDEEEDLMIQNSLEILEQAQNGLADMEGADHAKAMDEIYKETLDHSRNLMDLAYNVDDRARRGILEIAVSMYGKSIDAKNSKREAQLKKMKLLMDQQKLALDERKFKAEIGEEVVESKATVVEDRNELIKRIRAQAKEEQSNKD